MSIENGSFIRAFCLFLGLSIEKEFQERENGVCKDAKALAFPGMNMENWQDLIEEKLMEVDDMEEHHHGPAAHISTFGIVFGKFFSFILESDSLKGGERGFYLLASSLLSLTSCSSPVYFIS